MISVAAEVSKSDMAYISRVLRNADKDLMNDLKRSMVPEFKSMAQKIAADASANNAPMSGMIRGKGNTRWGSITGTLAVTPSKSARHLVTMNFQASRTARGLYIAEFAGSANMKYSKFPIRGPLFVKQLNTVVSGWEKGGRYIYRAFMPMKNGLYSKAQLYVEMWAEKVSIEVEKH